MTDSRAVLIIEDDPPTQLLLGAIAARHGLHAMIAGDGKAALDLVTAHDFDLVLLDLSLPLKNGTNVLRELAVSHPHLLRRIIVITAAQQSTYQECEEVRAIWAVVRKPFDLDVLEHTMLECRAGAATDGQPRSPHRVERTVPVVHLRRA